MPFLLFLVVVLVAALAYNLANLDTGGEAIPEIPDPSTRPSGGQGYFPSDPLVTAVVVGILGLLVLYAILRAKDKEGTPKAPSWWEMAAEVLGMIVIIALLFVWPRVVQVFEGTASDTSSPGTGGGSGGPWPTATGLPAGVFLLGSLLAAVLILAFLIRRTAVARDLDEMAPFEGFGPRRAAAQLVRRAMDELELGGDVRGAILQCFQQFCALLAGKGIADQEALTPRELSLLAVERLRVSTAEADALTSLFEVARYSDHRLGEADRERALGSLERIRAALEA